MDITLDFKAECDECGLTLNVTSEKLDIKENTVTITVEPCQRCLDNKQ